MPLHSALLSFCLRALFSSDQISGSPLTQSSSVFILEPLLELTVGPDALALVGRLRIDDATDSVLHAVHPLASVLAPVRVSVGAFSMLLVKLVVSFVLAAVLPDIVTVAVHHSVLERTLEVASIGPLERTVAAHLVIGPLARVLGTIGPEVDAKTLLHTIFKVTVIVASIAPHLDAFAILLVLPGDFGARFDRIEVRLDICAEVLSEDAKIGLAVLLPEAFVNFSRGGRRPEHSNSARLSIDPVAFESAAIGPNELAVAALVVLVVHD